VCAKDVNEDCGGLWGMKGKCGEGLMCRIEENPEKPWMRFQTPGVCVYKGELILFIVKLDFIFCQTKVRKRF